MTCVGMVVLREPMALDVLMAGECALEHAFDLPLPLLLMHGSQDKITSNTASMMFAQAVEGRSQYKLWDGFFHEIHNEAEQHQVFFFHVGMVGRIVGVGWVSVHSGYTINHLPI
jgi:hypothetical protein